MGHVVLDASVSQVCIDRRRVLGIGVWDASVRLSKKHLRCMQALLTLDLIFDQLQWVEVGHGRSGSARNPVPYCGRSATLMGRT
jgi:hypothetical protein